METDSLARIVVHNTPDHTERLLNAYIPVFDAASKRPMPNGYASKRAKQLHAHSVEVLTYLVLDPNNDVIGGSLVVELCRERPPEFIPNEIWNNIIQVGGETRRIFYHTALFKTSGYSSVAKLLAATRAHVGCHFYATISKIHRTIAAPNCVYVGHEEWLDEDRVYYCWNVD